jgi:uncharacterized membrane protein YphA (DoxX/SURF4 family)
MEKIKSISSKIEDVIEKISNPIKPYVPVLARILLTLTFLEDSVRMITQWDDQNAYLQNYQGMAWGVSHAFLITNIILMIGGSVCAILKKFTTLAVGALSFVVVIQTIGYGLLFDMTFFFRNLSVIGGLLMLLAETLMKKKDLFAGLPQMSEVERSTYLQLAGRILLVMLFISFLLAGEMDGFRIFMSVVGFVVSLMVVVGFKAKFSALFLVLCLSIGNILLNDWWSLHHYHPHRDFLKYDFFQTLSIMGGLLLLVANGPGGISYDEKKKAF